MCIKDMPTPNVPKQKRHPAAWSEKQGTTVTTVVYSAANAGPLSASTIGDFNLVFQEETKFLRDGEDEVVLGDSTPYERENEVSRRRLLQCASRGRVVSQRLDDLDQVDVKDIGERRSRDFKPHPDDRLDFEREHRPHIGKLRDPSLMLEQGGQDGKHDNVFWMVALSLRIGEGEFEGVKHDGNNSGDDCLHMLNKDWLVALSGRHGAVEVLHDRGGEEGWKKVIVTGHVKWGREH
ncbi:hypothetical protein CPB85DRAFT_1262541 [Mucidula mucida]|nr:hypothetical protein CPB85DRAFT_1262541 [Mucidula mucida]